jgi:ABC-type nitrate/sulfonate/bicarbonate transport system ATPase subunit
MTISAVEFASASLLSKDASAGGCLSIRDVCKTYDPNGASVEALRGCSLEVEAGAFVAIVGPSGCGKSTLLNMIAGFDTVSSGEVYMDEQLLAAPHLLPRPGPDRVVVFQNGALFPWKTVLQNVSYGPVRQKILTRTQAQKKAVELLRQCGLEAVTGSYPAQLSSGMQRRVEIARALMNDPKVLLLDEPFRAMDTVSKTTMHQHLLNMYRMSRKTVLFITHDLEEAIYLADRVVVMTTRPGTIKLVINVKLQRPRHPKMLFSKEYLTLKQEAAESVHEEARKAFERGEREQA